MDTGEGAACGHCKVQVVLWVNNQPHRAPTSSSTRLAAAITGKSKTQSLPQEFMVIHLLQRI